MARFATEKLYQTIQQWKQECLIKKDSLFWPKTGLWKESNITALKRSFRRIYTKKRDTSTIATRLEQMFDTLSETTLRLACEFLLIYWLYPQAPPFEEKKRRILQFASQFKNVKIFEDSERHNDIFEALKGGC